MTARLTARSRKSACAYSRPVVLLALAVGVIISHTGCGTDAYEQRLGATVRYFEYRQRVDEALQRNPWQKFGIEFRVPEGFQEIPGPAESENEEQEEVHDPRQPAFLSQPLPGLIGAWQGEVMVDAAGRDETDLPAWLFVCTNHQRFLNKLQNPEATPALLIEDLAKVLADELRYEPDTAVNPWQWEEVRVPQGTAYVPRKTYERITLNDELEIAGEPVRMDFQLIRYYVNEIQFCLLSVVPHTDILDRRERIYSRIELAMENLAVSGEKPRRQSAVQSSGGGF